MVETEDINLNFNDERPNPEIREERTILRRPITQKESLRSQSQDFGLQSGANSLSESLTLENMR